MHSLRKSGMGLALAGLGMALTAISARADVTLGGTYNNQSGDGYATAAGVNYTVLPSATFDHNGNSGLSINSSTLSPTTVTINGGDFSHNGFDGVFTSLGSTEIITGGSFNNNFDGIGAFNSTVSISGGDFTNNSGLSILSYGSGITLFGDFSTYGQLPSVPTFAPGFFTGRLQNNATSQTFSYGVLNGGTVTLAPAAVPEPSSLAVFGLGLGGVLLCVRKRRTAA